MLRNLTSLISVLLLTLACTEQNPTSRAEEPLYVLKPQITVVNYWAEWCKPCLKEIPEFNAFAKENPDIAVIGVNFDGLEGEELTAAMQKFDMQFEAWPIEALDRLAIKRPNALPTTLIFNNESALIATLVGPQSKTSLQAAVANL